MNENLKRTVAEERKFNAGKHTNITSRFVPSLCHSDLWACISQQEECKIPSQTAHCWSDDRQGLIPGVSSSSSTEPQKYTHHERESLFCSRLLTWRRARWSSSHVWCGWRSECCASRWAIVSSWTWRNCIRRSRRKWRRSRRRRSRWSEVCIPCCCSTWRLDPRSRKLRSSSRELRRRRSCYRALKRWSSKPRRSSKLLRWSSSCATSWWILHSLLIGLLLHRRRGRGIIRCLRSSRGGWPLPLSPHACDKWRESVSKAGYSTPMCFLARMCYFSSCSCCRWWSWHTGVWKTFTH